MTPTLRRRGLAGGWRRGARAGTLLALAALVCAGCGAADPSAAGEATAHAPSSPATTAGPDAEPTPMQETSYSQMFEVQQSTVLRLNNQWAIGVQMVYEGDYTDAAGQSQHGPLARLSLLDPAPGAKASTVTVHPGALVEAGARFQVTAISRGPDDGRPGSSQSTVTLGQLP